MPNHPISVSVNESAIAIENVTIATETLTPWEAVAAAPTAGTRKTLNTPANVPAIQPAHAVTIELKTNGTIAMIEVEIETATATETGTEIETATRETPATRTETETTVAKEIEIEIGTETGCEIPACIGMCLGCRTVCLAGNILSLKLFVVGFHLLRFWLQQESEC